jgi:hypothetical protein
MKPKTIAVVLIIAFQSLFLAGCDGYPDTPMVKTPGPDDRADILFFFKKETSNDEINHFLHYEVGVPDPNGHGFGLMEGIRGWFVVYRQGYEGYALELLPNITPEQRRKILDVIDNSPIIFRVYENVVPNEIILDPNYKDPNSTPNANDNRPGKKQSSGQITSQSVNSIP